MGKVKILSTIPFKLIYQLFALVYGILHSVLKLRHLGLVSSDPLFLLLIVRQHSLSLSVSGRRIIGKSRRSKRFYGQLASLRLIFEHLKEIFEVLVIRLFHLLILLCFQGLIFLHGKGLSQLFG
jgi:hypothetical protein